MASIRNHQLFQLTWTQFLETVREPEVLFWGMLFPVLISIGLGLAFTQTSESRYQVMTVDANHPELDTLLLQYGEPAVYRGQDAILWRVTDATLGNTEFHFVRSDWPAAIIALKRGEADLIVTGSPDGVRYHFDPHNSQAQLVYMKLSALMQSPVAAADTEQLSVEPLTLKGVRYIDFLIPGLITFGMMGSIMWGISYSIIERRSQKLLRRMVATPMRKSNFLMALMFVRILMNIVEAAIIFLFAWLIFDIRIQGNIAALLVLFLSGNMAFTGLAILVSCRTSRTEVGTGWINAVQMPMMLLSGIFFSYHNFPEWSLGIIRLLPLTAVTDGIRSIFNEGAGWMEILTPTVALTAFGLLCFIAGMRRFKWY
ncbi:MAG: ABC transporter permease [Tannerella sp.]|jgi:ABC-type multidrug transport system permease subunit|nr:ABC transporter permease [Tannerella sp.]